jgi:hypothetical protein
MLSPNKNRIDFGKALYCGMDGYELDYAIGTSYTLDLEAMLFLPVSLFFGGELEISNTASNEMLTALTQVPDKVQLFCQKGKIAPPFYYHQILEFWSNNIEQIEMDRYDASFHPKVWLIRYTSPHKPSYYKFISTSRNLSKSTDWDIAVTMEGFVGKKKIKQNESLFDFVSYLDQQAKRKIKLEFLDEIRYIKFDLESEDQMYAFHPIGNGWKNPVFDAVNKNKQMLCISPFLDQTSVKELSNKAEEVYLLSTQYELDKLPLELNKPNVECFQFNTLLELDPMYADENTAVADATLTQMDDISNFEASTSLHAKLFITTDEQESTWYIGSANCTLPTHSNRNIEFLTAIRSSDKSLMSAEQTLKILTEAEKNSEGFFVPYEKRFVADNSDAELFEQDLRKAIFDISKLNIEASIHENAQLLYDYQINLTEVSIRKREKWKIYFQPLSDLNGNKHKIDKGQFLEYTFENFLIHRLTPFFLFSIYEEDKLLKHLVIKLEIIFPEHRMRKIFSSLIENWEKLMKYISFLLTRDQVEPMLILDKEVGDAGEKKALIGGAWHSQFPIYEKLLMATSRNPKTIEQTIQIIEHLNDEVDADGNPIVEKDFKELIQTFSSFVHYER